jgi:hypothetical protein
MPGYQRIRRAAFCGNSLLSYASLIILLVCLYAAYEERIAEHALLLLLTLAAVLQRYELAVSCYHARFLVSAPRRAAPSSFL